MLKSTPRWDGTKTAIQRAEKTSVALMQTRMELLALHVAKDKIFKLYVNTASPYCDIAALAT